MNSAEATIIDHKRSLIDNSAFEHVWFADDEAGVALPFYLKSVLGVQYNSLAIQILDQLTECHQKFIIQIWPVRSRRVERKFQFGIRGLAIDCQDPERIEGVFFKLERKGLDLGDLSAEQVDSYLTASLLDRIDRYLNSRSIIS